LWPTIRAIIQSVFTRIQSSIGLNVMSDATTVTPVKTSSLDDNKQTTVAPIEATAESNQNSVIKDNGTEDEGEDSSPNKKIKLSNDVNDEPKAEVTTPPSAGRGRPAKGTKRLNIWEKTAKEGEALLQNLGHKAAGEENPDSNRRTTRSQTRGTPPASAVTPTPPKRATPKSPSNSSSGTPKRRGRPPKNSVSSNNSIDEKAEVDANAESNDVTQESQENNTSETNNESTANSTEPDVRAPEAEAKKVDEMKVAAKEQLNEVSANEVNNKTNSISDDIPKSVPVLETPPKQQPIPTSE